MIIDDVDHRTVISALEPAVRAPSVHNSLGGSLCPQLLLQVGWAPLGPQLPATPRRPIALTVKRVRDR
ncbi:hypothetical protein [Pseudonocardia cypriaca]|uniref:hypothetical protein n=1 Tax=Pseudonocardia cypriaca TaxID=882449 RepID=UPI0011511C58|nr:hypothetical protein [Pseudonocardia cypriaca]